MTDNSPLADQKSPVMDCFSQNMAVLRQHYPLLAEELDKAEDDLAPDELIVETASSGDPTLVCRGLYVHSKRDPRREAQRLVESSVAADETGENNTAAVFILGFGLGYTAAALAETSGKRPVIVVEKHPALLKKALETRDLGAFLSKTRLVFVLGGPDEGVTGALSLFKNPPDTPPLIIHNRTLTGMDEDWYKAVEGRIKTYQSRSSINRATQNRFGRRWVRNLSRNLEAIRDLPGISRLEGILSNTDIPVFLAAAGPSLDAAGPMLGEIAERCVTVAVDTSLRFLLSRGIDPDFAVSVDPQYWNYRHLDRVPAPKTCLVAESAVYPPVLRHPFDSIFLCGSFFPLGRFVEEKVDPKGELGAGGSVATSAWDFIRRLGGRTVWIAGLDLSFPSLKTHFKGAVFEEKSHAESSRFSPGETWNFRDLRDGQPFLAKARDGGTVLTDKRLSLYASWFENRFSQFHNKNYSLTDQGLAIAGLENGDAEELLALPRRRDEINHLLSDAYTAIGRDFNCETAKKLRSTQYDNAKRNLFEGLREIQNLALEAAQNAGIAANRNRQGHLQRKEQEQALKKLDAANKTLTASAVKEIAGFLFPDTTEWDTEIAAAAKDPLGRHLEFSVRFYRALAEAASFNLSQWL